VSLVIFAIYDKFRYGIVLPNAGYVLDVRMQSAVFAFKPQVGFLGLMLDRAFGFFPIAPVYLLSIVGAGKLLRTNRIAASFIFLPVVCYVIFLSFSQYWYGGWCPPARLLVTALALCAPLVGLSYASQRASRRVGLVLGMWTALVTFIHMAYPDTRYVADATRGRLGVFLQQNFGLDPLTYLFPSFIRARFADYLAAAVWAVLIIGGSYWLMTRRPEAHPDGEASLSASANVEC